MSELEKIVRPGEPFEVWVTPRAASAGVAVADGLIRVRVTVAPEGGKANKAVQEALAEALGVAKSRLTMVRGGTSRTKIFRLD